MKERSSRDILIGETEQINPAILLAEEFMRRDASDLLSSEDIDWAEEILVVGRGEIDTIKRQEAALERSPANPSIAIPVGF